MTIKQIVSSVCMFGLIASSNAMASESNQTKAEFFKLDSKAHMKQLSHSAINVFQKMNDKEYAFEFIPVEMRKKLIAEHDGQICLHCPAINSVILAPDGKVNCWSLHIADLSQQLSELEKENTELKERIVTLEKQTQ